MRLRNPHHPHADWHNDHEHFVYRCFDVDGVLLYIGFTWDLRTRIGAHCAPGRPVGERLSYVSVEKHPTRAAARAAERAAIESETPLFNVVHNVRVRAA